MGAAPHPLPSDVPTHDTPSDPPLMLVDGHNLLWGATFGFPAEIRSRDKTRLLTGLFAFFALLRVAVRDEIPGGRPEIIVVFDGQNGTAERTAIDPTYKAQRPTDDAALAPIHYLPDVRRGLDHCGIAWFELDNAEADDVIATIVTTHPDRHTIIMSRDRDYYQLITDQVTVLNTKTQPRLLNPAAILARHGVTPAQWADFRALVGDPADNIPGVPGIGAKTGAALLAGGMTLDQLPDSGRLAHGRARAVAEHLHNAHKWRDMIRLRTDLTLPIHPNGQPSPPLPAPRDVVHNLDLW